MTMLKDSVFNVRDEIVREAFAMSKQTVTNEHDEKMSRNYSRLTFTEFLEFLGRIVDLSFRQSEMDELPLEEKLEHFLTDLLPLVGVKYIKNADRVIEYSDSDDGY